MVLGPTARMWLPYLNFTVAISALGFQTAVLYPWHEELDKEFKVLKQEHREQLHLHQQVTIKKLEDLEKRLLVTEKAIPDVSVTSATFCPELLFRTFGRLHDNSARTQQLMLTIRASTILA
ncbi:hypothetical protein D6C95_07998 [Aureobasidium pullulans]|nr:hypothetical protein JADG_009098 [Aureobasidium pullulans]THY85004.1 hypothetical protein D6C95_07998 [Aureobasidium pullulans]